MNILPDRGRSSRSLVVIITVTKSLTVPLQTAIPNKLALKNIILCLLMLLEIVTPNKLSLYNYFFMF